MSERLSQDDMNLLMHRAIVDWCKIAKCNERWMDAHHYSNSHSKIILALWDKEDGCTQSDICHISGVSKQQVSAVLKDFEKNNYITRVKHADDERFNKIAITDYGREMCTKVNSDFCNFFRLIVEKCGENNAFEIMDSLSLLAEVYSKALDDRGY